jgi:homospermidine synthase
MGKFLEGWERARAAAEEREAEKHRRAERIAAALKQVVDLLDEDSQELARHSIEMRMEHGALVLRRMVEPMAGVTFDPEKNRFRIHKYSVREGTNDEDAQDAADCATKLGEYAHSLLG